MYKSSLKVERKFHRLKSCFSNRNRNRTALFSFLSFFPFFFVNDVFSRENIILNRKFWFKLQKLYADVRTRIFILCIINLKKKKENRIFHKFISIFFKFLFNNVNSAFWTLPNWINANKKNLFIFLKLFTIYQNKSKNIELLQMFNR